MSRCHGTGRNRKLRGGAREQCRNSLHSRGPFTVLAGNKCKLSTAAASRLYTTARYKRHTGATADHRRATLSGQTTGPCSLPFFSCWWPLTAHHCPFIFPFMFLSSCLLRCSGIHRPCCGWLWLIVIPSLDCCYCTIISLQLQSSQVSVFISLSGNWEIAELFEYSEDSKNLTISRAFPIFLGLEIPVNTGHSRDA